MSDLQDKPTQGWWHFSNGPSPSRVASGCGQSAEQQSALAVWCGTKQFQLCFLNWTAFQIMHESSDTEPWFQSRGEFAGERLAGFDFQIDFCHSPPGGRHAKPQLARVGGKIHVNHTGFA